MSALAAPKPTTAAMRLMRLVNSLLVLIIGISLFVFSEQTERYFAWTIASPLTAAWLGAWYWAAFIRELMDSRQPFWANARAAVPGVIVFSTLMLLATLLHLDRFHFGSPLFTARANAWAWTIVYALVPLALAILWARQERAPGGDPQPSARPALWARVGLYGLAAAMIVYGVALFLVPARVAPAWPWALTPLTGRAIAAWLVGVGIVLGRAALEDDLRRARSNFVFLLALGVLSLVAVARYTGEFAWDSARGWLYLLANLLALVLGAYGVYGGLRLARPANGLRTS